MGHSNNLSPETGCRLCVFVDARIEGSSEDSNYINKEDAQANGNGRRVFVLNDKREL